MRLADNLNASAPKRRIMPSGASCNRCPVRIARGSAGFPTAFDQLSHPPDELWVIGSTPSADLPLVGIVGARAASGHGCAQARDWADELGRQGVGIVSGGAFGIDAAAHEGALRAGTPTYAVLGCGVDVVYPDRHVDLFARISLSGGLLSEYAPGMPPRPGQFPARNRLIAALAQAVVVIEAADRSGALITARLARELGRQVLAVPGSPGTDRIIAKGQAQAVSSARDVLTALAGQAVCASMAEPSTGPLASVLQSLRTAAADPAELGRRMGIELPAALALLAEAELEGWVVRGDGNKYEVVIRGC
jgi:DNA processing protein